MISYLIFFIIDVHEGGSIRIFSIINYMATNMFEIKDFI
jgi:hypothetical protein